MSRRRRRRRGTRNSRVIIQSAEIRGNVQTLPNGVGARQTETTANHIPNTVQNARGVTATHHANGTVSRTYTKNGHVAGRSYMK